MNEADLPTPPAAPPVLTAPPPKLSGPSPWRNFIAILLSLYVGLFLLAAIVSVLDDSCVLLAGSRLFTIPSAILSLIILVVTILFYGLMGLTPVIPKRVVLPVLLLVLFSLLGTLPAAIYYYPRLQQFDLAASCILLAGGILLVHWLQGGWKFRWPLVTEKHLGTRSFSWLHIALFLLLNLFVVLPALAAYGFGCAGLAVNHFTEGFVSLRPVGLVMQARKYARDDGKTVLLFPMSHIAEPDFYHGMAQLITSNSVVLLEGVTDTNHLLTSKLTYKRAAKTLNLSDQHEGLQINRGEMVRADVDIKDFSSNTIVLLNMVALLYSEGINSHTLSLLMNSAPPPGAEDQMFDDVLLKRNAHLLSVFRTRLPDADEFIIPWGAAHMAGISREIQKSGFHLVATRDYISIRFGSKKGENGGAGWVQQPKNSN